MSISSEQYRELIILTQRFSLMIFVGLPLRQALAVLGEEGAAPYGAVFQAMRDRVQAGQLLAQTFDEAGDVLPPIYLQMMRIAESGNILDEVLPLLTELMELDWRYGRELGYVLFSDTPPQDFSELSAAQQALRYALFCRCFGLLLSSGVPIIPASGVVTELLPIRQRIQWEEIRRRLREEAGWLDATGVLSPFITQLCRIGEELGSLDVMLQKAGETYAREVALRCDGGCRNGG